MFAGIGDARNLFCTLLVIMGDEVKGGKKNVRANGRLYHFTLVDIKPAVIARDLLVFLLLHDIGEGMMDDNVLDINLMPCLYYLYVAPVMPRSVFDILQKRIQALIEMLDGRQKLPSFLDVPQLYRPQILRVLKQWQEEAAKEWPAERIRKAAVLGREQDRTRLRMQAMQYGMDVPPERTLPACAKEKRFYEATGLLPLTSDMYKLYGPELRACINDHARASGAKAKSDVVTKAVRISQDTWAPNVTFVDLDWQRNKPDEEPEIDVCHNMFDFAADMEKIGFPSRNARGLFDYLQNWFAMVSTAFHELGPRLKIEACVGDVTAVLEQIRYGVVGHRQQTTLDDISSQSSTKAKASNDQDINDYPQKYDRIHLSNIPDYIGGTLSSFLYATPVTFADKACYVTSTNLRNPPRFETTESFDHEYTALSAPADLEAVFRVQMEPLEDPDEQMPTCRYNEWRQCDSKKLMPREQLKRWFQRLFLKLAMPIEKLKIEDDSLIYSPINSTVFFRLLIHLQSAGYPSHWLSEIWEQILSGSIVSSARPPRSEPLSIKESKANTPAIEQSTKPFVAELTTLTTLWQPILPFAISSPNLPRLDQVHKYSVRFQSVKDNAANIPTFILAFYDKKMPETTWTSSLRKHLLDDEKGLPKMSSNARKINDEGLHIITTWKYERETRTATFWFRQDVLEKLKSQNKLRVAIWRTDNWTRQSSPQQIVKIHDHGVWVRGEDTPMPEPSSDVDEDEEDDESSSSDDDQEGFRGQYLPSGNPQMDSLTSYMESVMRSMPGDSRDQRLRLAESLMNQGMREKMNERR